MNRFKEFIADDSDEEVEELYVDAINNIDEANIVSAWIGNKAINGLVKSKNRLRNTNSQKVRDEILGSMLVQVGGMVLISIATGTKEKGILNNIGKLWNIVKGSRAR